MQHRETQTSTAASGCHASRRGGQTLTHDRAAISPSPSPCLHPIAMIDTSALAVKHIRIGTRHHGACHPLGHALARPTIDSSDRTRTSASHPFSHVSRCRSPPTRRAVMKDRFGHVHPRIAAEPQPTLSNTRTNSRAHGIPCPTPPPLRLSRPFRQ